MGEKDAVHYSTLFKAASLGDWDTAEKIFDADPNAIEAKISPDEETALHVTVASGHSIVFVKNLVDLMSKKGKRFDLVDKDGNTVLHYAAIGRNTRAAEIIVDKYPLLHMVMNRNGYTPLHVTAQYGHEDTTWFLYSLIPIDESPDNFNAIYLLNVLIMVDLYDIAIDLVKRYPKLALQKDDHGRMALYELAQKPQAFPSGIQHSYWKRVLYYFFSGSSTNEYKREDIENPKGKSEPQLQESKGVYGFLRDINNTKLMHHQALELLRLLIAEVLKSGASKANEILRNSLGLATRFGIHEFVAEVIKAYPASVELMDKDLHNVFDVAVIFRQEKVYNLLYQIGSRKHFMMGFDVNDETMLHLAAKYVPHSRINRISGAALQMQRELQWYKEVEQVVQPSYAERPNKDEKLPKALFTESHENLVKQGEKWMKGTATSCTIVATLVVTIVFAAALTVPGSNNGGDNNTNNSNFLKDVAYMVFFISNALALFSSATSVLMFLGILTSRYLEEDFLMALPMRLAIGLVALFFSIAFMLVAFSAALHIVLVHQVHWIAVPIGLLACVPVTLFASLQFPLLVEIMASTFRSSIFGKQNDELLM